MVNAQLATKAEMVLYLEYSGFKVEEEDIPDEVDKLGIMLITMWLERESITIPSDLTELEDISTYGYIWAASFCITLELLAMRGQVQFSSGDVQKVRTGNVETMMQRWQPMFFFAKGMARGFYELLPHDTYRMMFYQLLKSWKIWRFKKENARSIKKKNKQYFYSYV